MDRDPAWKIPALRPSNSLFIGLKTPYSQVTGLDGLLIVDDPCLDTSAYDRSSMKYGQRFGKLIGDFPLLGELRKQRKAPNKEVLYIWVEDPGDPPPSIKTQYIRRAAPALVADSSTKPLYVLRAASNSSNDQLVKAIRRCGELVESHQVDRLDGEQVLDLLYIELARKGRHA